MALSRDLKRWLLEQHLSMTNPSKSPKQSKITSTTLPVQCFSPAGCGRFPEPTGQPLSDGGNGYVVELTASTGVQQEIMDPAISKPHDALARWQAAKPGQPGAAA
jgi:hypothetical protein